MTLTKPTNVASPVLSHFSLSGKVAAVTGGARGIGLEVVRALAEAGASVALIYTSSKDAEETAKAISDQTGQNVVAYKSDVRSKETITKTLDQIASDFGSLDIVVANAGIASHFDSLEYTVEQWRDIMAVNLDGAMYTAQAAGNIFKSQKEAGGKGDGSFIFTASVSATLVNVPQKQAAYNASKAAVVHLAKCLAVEWIDFGRGMLLNTSSCHCKEANLRSSQLHIARFYRDRDDSKPPTRVARQMVAARACWAQRRPC